MSIFWWIVIITAIAGVGGTGLGGLVGAVLRRDSEKIVSLLLAFAGGVMLAVVCFDLLHEAIEPHKDNIGYIFLVIGCTIAGYLIVFGLNKLIDLRLKKEVPHTSEDHPDVHDDLGEIIHADHLEHHKKSDNRLFEAGLVMAIVIALHNLPEGMVIGATYAKQPNLIIGGSALIIAVIIGIHNIPEGMAVGVVFAGFITGKASITAAGAMVLAIGIAIQNFPEGAIISMPLRSEGMSRTKAFVGGALTGAVEPVGALLTIVASGFIIPALPYLLTFAAGAMMYVVVEELIPEMSEGEHSNLATIAFSAGFTLMMALDVVLG